MEQILNQLSKRLGKPPFTVNSEGKYHIVIDGESIFTYRSGNCLVVSSYLNWHYQPDSTQARDLLKSLLCQVTSWSREYPQGLVLNDKNKLMLEARRALAWLDIFWLERTLAAQVGMLEQLKPQLFEAKNHHQWNQVIWRP